MLSDFLNHVQDHKMETPSAHSLSSATALNPGAFCRGKGCVELLTKGSEQALSRESTVGT